MSRKKEIIPGATIEDVAAEGKSIARVNDKVVFVDYAAPGDVADLLITKKKKNYNEATAIRFHQYSTLRAEPFCPHYGVCGGCKWQHLDYDAQLDLKRKQVIDSLERIAKVAFPEVPPVIRAHKTRYYRNKLEFTFSNRKWLTREQVDSGEDIDRNALGFHLPGRFDRVLDIEQCFLQEEPSNEIRLALKRFAIENRLEFYDVLAHTGFLRNLVIRIASTGEIMVIVQAAQNNRELIGKTMDFLAEKFPGISSLYYVVNEKKNDSYFDLEPVLYRGKPDIVEKLEDLEFRIGPKTFFQTNSEQALKLYSKTREFAALSGSEVVYDLYTGAGSIANFVARQAKKVVGVESVAEAVDDAAVNSQANGISNTVFVAGDASEILTGEFTEAHGKPDVVIADPPRAGMHKDVVERLLLLEPARIVYVSCNPATQARDAALLDQKYEIAAVQPVDMFPHTHHVENILLFKRRS